MRIIRQADQFPKISSVCSGSGRKWSRTSLGPPARCPVCHRSPEVIGVKMPKKNGVGFDGVVPEHEQREP